ncbi:MAG: hypothetical protein KUA43_22345 [Hoeflea sp.]|uniref:hypothetical protein n=1 Tax=Hoeflea sp. TaxID=1940281 RepID=UPI001DDA6F48|nr:hypothetical protein [Hoeflea sp.]MBU4528586.1 hypothetical protein [Alphaproteobacteria bacterium]MBU4545609.1 hypothetical protein [Alphaproteobacteria bacterium]MBU4552219.1 hypothetical protein [Alphaproteobacteria bacterium]MBV1726189.1 hypothetical protein [Hoeflea sp.]MBV1762384.1 hypothetical protein [Hoeflea sp.]
MIVREDRSFEKIVAAMIGLVLVLMAIGWVTREDPAEKPYIGIAGGGFIFNYREAQVFYGFTAHVLKPLPVGTLMIADFEDPGGGPRLTVETRLHARSTRYGVHSPNVRGVKAGQSYQVSIRLYDHTRTKLIWSAEKSFTSQVDDSVVPDKPLTIGPGYFPNPELTNG